jgi:hypothetical protein
MILMNAILGINLRKGEDLKPTNPLYAPGAVPTSPAL